MTNGPLSSSSVDLSDVFAVARPSFSDCLPLQLCLFRCHVDCLCSADSFSAVSLSSLMRCACSKCVVFGPNPSDFGLPDLDVVQFGARECPLYR